MNLNVLLIGKSGAGKSSLINYLWGQPIARTATGAPETPEKSYDGSLIYPCPPIKWRGLDLIVYDTWGLEAERAEEWRNKIFERIRERDMSMKVADWMHVILYCVSAKGARLEPFESETVTKLEQSGYTVLFVLTKSGSASEDERQGLRKHIQVQHPKSAVVEVNSVTEAMRSGAQKLAFGKEECFDAITAVLALTLRQCWFRSLCTAYEDRLKKLKQKLLDVYDNKAGYLTSTQSKLEAVANAAKEHNATLIQNLEKDGQRTQQDILEILQSLSSNNHVPSSSFPLAARLNGLEPKTLRWDNWDHAFAVGTNLIPLLGPYMAWTRTKRVRDELDKGLTQKFKTLVDTLRSRKHEILPELSCDPSQDHRLLWSSLAGVSLSSGTLRIIRKILDGYAK